MSFGEDRIKQFNIQQGEDLTVQFDIDAHEFNGRWFNDIRAYNVIRGQQPVAGQPMPGASMAAPGMPQATPFPPADGATAPFPPAQETICLSKKVPVGWPNKHNKSNKSLCGVRIPRRFSFLCPLIVAGLFHLIHQFLALAEVKDVLEGGEGDVVYGLTGEECLVGGHDDVGHHQQQGQLVVVNHLV